MRRDRDGTLLANDQAVNGCQEVTPSLQVVCRMKYRVDQLMTSHLLGWHTGSACQSGQRHMSIVQRMSDSPHLAYDISLGGYDKQSRSDKWVAAIETHHGRSDIGPCCWVGWIQLTVDRGDGSVDLDTV